MGPSTQNEVRVARCKQDASSGSENTSRIHLSSGAERKSSTQARSHECSSTFDTPPRTQESTRTYLPSLPVSVSVFAGALPEFVNRAHTGPSNHVPHVGGGMWYTTKPLQLFALCSQVEALRYKPGTTHETRKYYPDTHKTQDHTVLPPRATTQNAGCSSSPNSSRQRCIKKCTHGSQEEGGSWHTTEYRGTYYCTVLRETSAAERDVKLHVNTPRNNITLLDLHRKRPPRSTKHSARTPSKTKLQNCSATE